ncbi:MAG: hypothetical protein H6Q20_2298 [Bacteroidetes bacterium]|nr:hypothetical protein [Bacteroidota bacterium]
MNRSIFRYLSLALLSVFLFAACSTTKQIAKVCTENVSRVIMRNPELPDYIVLKTDNLPQQDAFAIASKEKGYIIPALIFWSWSYGYRCEISSLYFEKLFIETITKKAKESGLGNFMGDKRIELSLDQVPNVINYSKKGMAAFFFVGYSYAYDDRMYLENQALKVNYKIISGDKQTSYETFTYQFNKSVPNNKFSFSSFLDNYVDELGDEYTYACAEFIDKLIDDL